MTTPQINFSDRLKEINDFMSTYSKLRNRSFIIKHSSIFEINNICWSSEAVLTFKKLWDKNDYSLKKLPEEKEENIPNFLEPHVTPAESSFNEPFKMQPLF